MKVMEIPTLKAEDIEVKIKQVGQKGAVALLYKTARTDMEYLDKVFGIGNWQCDYKEIKGNLYCTISIWDEEKNQWVNKVDCGIESREDGDGNEKKGEASDAFKRAGFKVGIGRELYSAPFTFLNVATEQDGTDNRGKPRYKLKDPFDRYDVAEIDYDKNRKISRLRIVSTKTGTTVYEYGTRNTQSTNTAPKGKKTELKPETAKVEKTDKIPQPVFNAEQAYKAFCQSHGLTPTQFTAWRDKASSDPNTGIAQIPFKELTSEQWQFLLTKLEQLAKEGYFNE